MARWLMTLGAGAALLLAACGGGDDDDTADPTSADATAEANGATAEPTATKVDRPRTTPTPAADDSIALAVILPGGEPYEPTVAEFRELPATTVGDFTGVSLEALAAQVGAEGDAIVNIDGRAPGETRGFVVRYRLSEIAATTVLVVDEQGHVNVKSTTLPANEQLTAVTAVSFTQ